MVGHKAITIGICNWSNVCLVFAKKERVVGITSENLFTAVRTVVNVIKSIRFKRNHVSRVFNFCFSRPARFLKPCRS